MLKERHPRGFKILDKHQKAKKTIHLFAKNGSRYIILINYHYWGFCLRSRLFEFNDLNQAYSVFHRLRDEKHPELPTVRLLQRQSSGF